jgi:hypothetical protein
MINLMILAGVLLVALRIFAPVLRVVIWLMVRLIGLTLFVAVLALCLIALLTHGAFI